LKVQETGSERRATDGEAVPALHKCSAGCFDGKCGYKANQGEVGLVAGILAQIGWEVLVVIACLQWLPHNTIFPGDTATVTTALSVVGIWIASTNVLTLFTWRACRTRGATQQLLDGRLYVKMVMIDESINSLWPTAVHGVADDPAYWSYILYSLVVTFAVSAVAKKSFGTKLLLQVTRP
jgi:hypothetical protein